MYPKVKVREEKYQVGDEHGAVGLQLLESLSLDVPSSPEREHRDAFPIFLARIPKSPLRTVFTSSKEAENNKRIDEKEKPNIGVTFLTHDPTLSAEAENDKRIDEKEKPNIGDTFLSYNSVSSAESENDKRIDEKEKPNIGVTFLTYDFTDAEKNIIEIEDKEKPNIKASSILRPRAVLSSPNNDAVVGNKNRLKAERPAALRNHYMVPNIRAKPQSKASPTHIKCQVNRTISNNVPDDKIDLKGKKETVKVVSSQRKHTRTWRF